MRYKTLKRTDTQPLVEREISRAAFFVCLYTSAGNLHRALGLFREMIKSQPEVIESTVGVLSVSQMI
jgi:pentatricopeptide repeat protein